jgi:Zn-dependent protease with chaperone function
MHYSVYAGLGFAAMFGLVAPYIARRVSPAVATWLLTTGGLVAGVSGIGALGLLAMTLIAQNPAIAAEGHWSIATLRRADPVRFPVALAALALLGGCLARFAMVSIKRSRALTAAYRLNHAVADTGTDLVVLAEDSPDAYAVPGRPGRIFVTRGMLTLLSRDEYDVMLAHERSHLRHGHHWHRTAVVVARSLNPLLQTLPRTQDWVTERWADEDAARANSRAVVASALSHAATAERPVHRPAGTLALTSQTVDSRIAALLDEPPRRHPLMLVAALGILVLSVCGTFDGVTDEAQLFHASVPSIHDQLTRVRPPLLRPAMSPVGPAHQPALHP